MRIWQKILLIATVLVLLVVAIRFWGSIGSAVMVFCLITMCAALLFQRFVNADRDNDFMEDNNG